MIFCIIRYTLAKDRCQHYLNMFMAFKLIISTGEHYPITTLYRGFHDICVWRSMLLDTRHTHVEDVQRRTRQGTFHHVHIPNFMQFTHRYIFYNLYPLSTQESPVREPYVMFFVIVYYCLFSFISLSVCE